MDQYRLFSLPDWLPLYLWPVWPLIFWRICRLEAWFEAAGGPGSQMLWYVDRRGRVRVARLSDDLTGQARAPRLPAPSAQYLAALDGSLSKASQDTAHPRECGDLMPYIRARLSPRLVLAVPAPDP